MYSKDPIDIINIVSGNRIIDYLEVGVDQGSTFNLVKNTRLKHGIDPYGACENITHRMTSQMFFLMNKHFFKNRYDVIFLDGLHISDMLEYEIEESLKILNDDGFILLHDTVPLKEDAQKLIESDFRNILEFVMSKNEKERLCWHENTQTNGWIGYNGDVWKVVPKYLQKDNLTVFTIPDACISIITKKHIPELKSNEKIENKEFAWDDYSGNFKNIMNPIEYNFFEDLLKRII